MRPFYLVLSALVIATTISSTAIAGAISGTLTDASNGKPYSFATVEIIELGMTVHTDSDGRYLFKSIPSGRYTIAVTHGPYVDYAIGTVDVVDDSTVKLDAALQPDIEPIRPAAKSDDDDSDGQTIPRMDGASTRSLQDQPIHLLDLPIRGYADWIATQPGTVRRFYGAPIHVRGGRIEEFTYYVDGFSQQDPFTGRSFTGINGNSIRDIEFRPGYLPPGRGWTASGQADVTTTESWRTTGSLEVITDNFHGERSDYSLYAADLSGALAENGTLSYALAGEYRTFGNRDPGGPGDWNSLGAWHGNLRWRPSDGTRAFIGTRGSYEDWKYTPLAWYFNSVHAPRGVDDNYSVFGKLEHDFTSRTKISGAVDWFSVKHRQGDGVHFDDVWAYGRPGGNPRFDQTTLFWSWDDRLLDPDSLAIGHPVVLRTAVVETTLTVPLGPGESIERSFILGGDEGAVWDDYFEQSGSYIGGRFDFSHAHSRNGEAMLGMEFQRHTVRSYNHLFPTLIYQGRNGGVDDIDRYGYDALGNESDDEGMNGAKHPLFLAGYVSEHIERDDLSLELGARWDYFDYTAQALLDPDDPLDPFGDRERAEDTSLPLTDEERNALRVRADSLDAWDIMETDPISRLSPRVAFAYRINDASSVLLTGSRYVQRLPLRFLYTNFDYLEYKIQTGGYLYHFANARLEPTSVVHYDATWTQEFGDIVTANASAFVKHFNHFIEPTTQPAVPNSFTTYRNTGSATAKGLVIEVGLKRQNGLAAQVGYTLTDISDDDRSYANTQSNIAWTMAVPPNLSGPFTFEQEHRFVGILDLRRGPDSGPLSNAGITALFEAGSGFPYSPVEIYNAVTLGAILPQPAGPFGSERTPATYRLDLKANKSISISGADLEIYLWVINLFDRANVVDVYEGTGEPDNTGWLGTGEGQEFVQVNNQIHDASFLTGKQKYLFRENDPANFDISRQIRFGIRAGF